jgi:hypothetical protein
VKDEVSGEAHGEGEARDDAAAGRQAVAAPSSLFQLCGRKSDKTRWRLAGSFTWPTSAVMPNFVRSLIIRLPTGESWTWPTMVGETKRPFEGIAQTLPQYHVNACAVLRPLQLVFGLTTAVHLGRIAASGCVQYFATYFRDGKYCTQPISDEFSLLGLSTDEERAVQHKICCFEEACIHHAWVMEQHLPKYAFIAFRGAVHPEFPREEYLDDFALALTSGSSLPLSPRECAPMPSWWCSQQGYVSLQRALEGRHYFIQRILKVSAYSVVAMCTSRRGRTVVKLRMLLQSASRLALGA